VDSNLEIDFYKPRAPFHHPSLVKNGIRGILLKILKRKRNEWIKYSLRQHLALHRREIFLNGKHVKRETYILIIQKCWQ
jgi:hypothetical protein